MGKAAELAPDVMAEIASEALAAARATAGLVTLRLHPGDLAAVERERPRLLARVGVGVDVRLVSDESVGRQGCVVETALGRLDARLATQLDVLERALGGTRAGDRAKPALSD